MPRLTEPNCPVCDSEVTGPGETCPRCGLPLSLREEALRTLTTRDPYVRPPAGNGPGRRSAGARPAAKRRGETVEPAADELDRAVMLLRRLDGTAEELAGEIHRAAWAEIRGDPTEAVRLLRAATIRANEAALTHLEGRRRDLDARIASLVRDGLVPSATPAEKIGELLHERRFEEVSELLDRCEREIEQLEAEVESVRAPLREFDEILALARSANIDLPGVAEEVARLRASMSGSAGSAHEAAERAQRTLAELRGHLPAALREELDRHDEALRAYPDAHARAAAARALHARTRAHLESGRLAEAVESLEDLRGAIRTLGPPPVPEALRPPAEPLADPGSRPAPGPQVARLIEMARRLAGQIRALEPDGELATEAAADIRRATEFLRERRLAEAEALLTSLTHRLATGPIAPPEGAPP